MNLLVGLLGENEYDLKQQTLLYKIYELESRKKDIEEETQRVLERKNELIEETRKISEEEAVRLEEQAKRRELEAKERERKELEEKQRRQSKKRVEELETSRQELKRNSEANIHEVSNFRTPSLPAPVQPIIPDRSKKPTYDAIQSYRIRDFEPEGRAKVSKISNFLLCFETSNGILCSV